MRLLVQPLDTVAPLVRALNDAKKSIAIVIIRLDQDEIERALWDAVNRGVFVRALIARNSLSGDESLRGLEMRLLDAGITVTRTSDDLPRYHDKLLIIDQSILYLMAFNFTYLDIERSRSFAIMTTNARLVQEAVRLFEADAKRQRYVPALPTLVVSPLNARQQLSRFIRGAKKELLIYDPRISDRPMIRSLEERARAGVEISIIGRVSHHSSRLIARMPGSMRIKARTIIRDRRQAFVGSQSLRQVELDESREAGIIVRDSKIASRLANIFEEDWIDAQNSAPVEHEPANSERVMEKVADTIARDLPPLAPILKEAVRGQVGISNDVDVDLDAHEVEDKVKEALKEVVREIFREVVEDAIDRNRRGYRSGFIN